MLGDGYSNHVTPPTPPISASPQDTYVSLIFTSIMKSVIPLNIQEIIRFNILPVPIARNKKNLKFYYL